MSRSVLALLLLFLYGNYPINLEWPVDLGVQSWYTSRRMFACQEDGRVLRTSQLAFEISPVVRSCQLEKPR